MVLSSKTISALKLLIDLGERYSSNELVSLNDAAKRKDLSKKFLEQIVPILKQAGLIIGSRGNQGGYKLNKNPSDISIKEILILTESLFNKTNSGSQAIDSLMNDSDNLLDDFFTAKTLQDLIDLQLNSYSNSYIIWVIDSL